MKLKMADTGETLVDSATNFPTLMCNSHPLAPSDNSDETRGLENKLTYCLSLRHPSYPLPHSTGYLTN